MRRVYIEAIVRLCVCIANFLAYADEVLVINADEISCNNNVNCINYVYQNRNFRNWKAFGSKIKRGVTLKIN